MPLYFSVLTFGLLLGIRHATDADHLVAIITVVSKQKKMHQASLIGILWGLGHSITVIAVAIPIIFFSFLMPARLGLSLEFIVGMMLVVLGILNLSRVTKQMHQKLTETIHSHTHSHQGVEEHTHFHIHNPLKNLSTDMHHLGIFHTIRPIVIGLFHGLAGSTAIALFVISTIHNATRSFWYLLVFNLGVIIGMLIITSILGLSISLARKRVNKLHMFLIYASGILSLALGLYVMYQTGIVAGLFSKSVHWNPS